MCLRFITRQVKSFNNLPLGNTAYNFAMVYLNCYFSKIQEEEKVANKFEISHRVTLENVKL